MDRRITIMGYLFLVGLLLGSFFLSPMVQAEETGDPPLPEKLMVRGGWAYVFGATVNAGVAGPVLGLGTTVDFTNTLGGRSSTDAFRVDTLYRFNDRHALGFSWYRVGLGGEKALNQQIQIRDNIVAAGAATQTSLSLNTYRLLYNYSFYRNDKVELGVSPGLYMMRTTFNFAAQGTINGVVNNTTLVNEQITLPLPSIGFVANYNITPRLAFQSRYDFFYLSINKYTGAMFEFYAGLEYRLFKHFALGAAYDRLQASLRGDGNQGFNIDFSYNLAYVYASLYAF
ncbi:DUF481 domain-containing protein [Nitrospira sp. KM1]|uniref:hypothetical protein n=1 Tax=Nitrospira sp. KM1 TaxID=1936990 RepID=UPI0013A77203|nr:hypothetical protein [Nitrospira sp. KM1]BCA53066.1 DUF481 domain-containing protein [Nitrospira sp. KM1]